MREYPPRERRARALLLKACPRCQGDLFWREDVEGERELHCLQCGRTVRPEHVLPERKVQIA